MNSITVIGSILFIVSLIMVIYILSCKKTKHEEGEIIRLHETQITAFNVAIAYILGAILLILQYRNPNFNGYTTIAHIYNFVLYCICIFLGHFVLLYTFIKTDIATTDEIVAVSLLGTVKSIRWNDISKIEATMSKRLRITSKNGNKALIGGERKSMKKFLNVVLEKIDPEIGEDIVLRLINKI